MHGHFLGFASGDIALSCASKTRCTTARLMCFCSTYWSCSCSAFRAKDSMRFRRNPPASEVEPTKLNLIEFVV